MSRAYTPGPWRANGSSVVASPDTFRFLFDCKPLRMTLGVEECQANARLIAAAPDLLEALEHVRDTPEFAYLYPGTKDEILRAITKALCGSNRLFDEPSSEAPCAEV